jgi:putative endonuclease
MARRVRTEPPGATPVAPRPARLVAFRFGLSAESRAAAYLIAKGYRIVARRWRSPAGEIDIVARRRGTLIFVEVKARERLDDAAEAVIMRQQRRIIAAAEAWLARHPDDVNSNIRFDVVLVAPKSLPRHIQAAFDASN